MYLSAKLSIITSEKVQSICHSLGPRVTNKGIAAGAG